jgi:thiol-disulfide isomerase/thioredoxin
MRTAQGILALALLVTRRSTVAQETAGRSKPELLFFTAVWCEPCQKVKPVVSKLAKEYDVQFVSVDFDKSPYVVADFQIEVLPTFILLGSDQKLLMRAEGASRGTVEALTTAMKSLKPLGGRSQERR